MSLVGKLVSEFEIDTSAKKFYKFFKDHLYQVPKVSPNNIQSIQIIGGDWENHGHGSIKVWNYFNDGKPETFKEQVEYDDEKFTITLVGLEGNLFEHYKSLSKKIQVVPKGPEISSVVLRMEYEKLNDGSPDPYQYLHILTKITKDIASHVK